MSTKFFSSAAALCMTLFYFSTSAMNNNSSSLNKDRTQVKQHIKIFSLKEIESCKREYVYYPNSNEELPPLKSSEYIVKLVSKDSVRVIKETDTKGEVKEIDYFFYENKPAYLSATPQQFFIACKFREKYKKDQKARREQIKSLKEGDKLFKLCVGRSLARQRCESKLNKGSST